VPSGQKQRRTDRCFLSGHGGLKSREESEFTTVEVAVNHFNATEFATGAAVRTRESMPTGTAGASTRGPHRARRQVCGPLLRNIEPKAYPHRLGASSSLPAMPTQGQLRQAAADNCQALWDAAGQLQPSLEEQRKPRYVRRDFRKTNDTSDIEGNRPRLRLGRNAEGVLRREQPPVAEPARPATALERRRALRTPWPDEAPLAQAVAATSKATRRVDELLVRRGFTPEDRARLVLAGRTPCPDRVCGRR